MSARASRLRIFILQSFHVVSMKKNCGTKDRAARIVFGILVGVAYVMGYIKGLLAIVLGLVALSMFVTGAVGYCPAYVPLNADTREED